MPNLLGKLYCVHQVFEENAPNEIHVNKNVHFALGHSRLHGIFNTRKEANECARKLETTLLREGVQVNRFP